MAASKVIVLTGASRGIGLAIAHSLLKNSHKVVLVSRTAAPLEEVKKQYPGQVEYVAADLSDYSVSAAGSSCNRLRFYVLSCLCLLAEKIVQ